MIRALVWKEAREQGLIVAALAVLGAAVLVAVGLLNPAAGGDRTAQQVLTDPGFLALVALTVTAGTVVGGTLFAGEKEAGTFAYLVGLPVPRWKVWAGKICGGAVLVLAVAAPLFAVAAAVGIVGPPNRLAGWALAGGAVVLAAFGWGSVGSVMTRNSLAAAGLGALFAALAGSALLPIGVGTVNEFARRARLDLRGWDALSVSSLGVLATVFAVFALPFVISLWSFTEPDRNRKYRAILGPTGRRKRRLPAFRPFGWVKRIGGGFRAAAWLTWRQTRLTAAVLCGLGLVGGVSLLAPGAPLMAVWPPVTLFLAVLVGVIGWADEQGNGAGRFWVERRTPVSRLWAAKALGGLAVTFAVCLAVALPTVLKFAAVKTPPEDRGSWLLFEYDFPRWKYLLVWPVYGFAVGHLVGLLFRKTMVAVSVAAMVAATAAAVWLPSLLAGGVRHWQLWLPPVLVLAAARGLVWSMAADRVGTRRALRRLAVGGLAVLVTIGAGVAYRVLEIPDVPERFDDVAYRADIPPFEANDVGRELRRAALLFQEVRDGRPSGLRSQFTGNEPTPSTVWQFDDTLRWFPDPRRRQLESVMEHGWQPGDAEFEGWLDATLAAGWAEVIEAAAEMPLGTVEDPIELTLNTPLRHLHGLSGADTVLLVQALRRQAGGDPAAFVRAYEAVLGLSRNVRNKSVLACGLVGRLMERRAHQALRRWLEKLHGRDDLIVQAWCALARHTAWATDDEADVRLAEQVVFRNTVAAPGEVLKRQWRYSDAGTDETVRRVMDTEADLVGFAWQVPWERERLSRLVGLGNRRAYPTEWDGWADDLHDWAFPPDSRRRDFDQMERFPFTGLPGVGWRVLMNSWNLHGVHAAAETRVVADRRAAELLLALRRFELDRGAVPKALDELVPGYLPAVPLDPCDGRPFRYRVWEDGGTLTAEERTAAPELPTAREMMREPNVLTRQWGMGGLAGVPDEPPYDPNATITGQAILVAQKQDWADGGWFDQLRTANAAVLGNASLLDTYVPLFVPTGSQTGPHKRQVVLPPGTAVLWSVGADKIDHGGVAYTTAADRAPLTDWVYVVPPLSLR